MSDWISLTESSYSKEKFHKTVYILKKKRKKLPKNPTCQIAWKYQDWLKSVFLTKNYKFTRYHVFLRGWNILKLV